MPSIEQSRIFFLFLCNSYNSLENVVSITLITLNLDLCKEYIPIYVKNMSQYYTIFHNY